MKVATRAACLVMAALVCLGGCKRAVVRTEAEAEVAEPWVSMPTRDWPQLVLTHRAEFDGHTSLEGASAFLIRDERQGVLGVTALHLLGENGGVEPRLAPEDLDRDLKRWRLFPRTAPSAWIEVGGLAAPSSGEKHYDWLALRLKPAVGDLPSTALKLRTRPVAVGETVHLVGVSYAEPKVRQNVYSGRVTGRAFGDRFKYDLSPAVDLRGFSGAPILDEKGFVVGVMTVWFHPKMNGDLMTEGGGEDAKSLAGCLERSPSGTAAASEKKK